jgi:hypothetical protein
MPNGGVARRSILAGVVAVALIGSADQATWRVGPAGPPGPAARVDRCTSQLCHLAASAGDERVNRIALRRWRDRPPELRDGDLYLDPGVATFRLVHGRPVRDRPAVTPVPSLAVLRWRGRLPGSHGRWMQIGSGPLTGRYVRERPGVAYVRGEVDELTLRVPMTLGTNRIIGYAVRDGVPAYRTTEGSWIALSGPGATSRPGRPTPRSSTRVTPS